MAAVGTAGGAGLPFGALAAATGHFLITCGFPPLARATVHRHREPPTLRLGHADGHGVLRRSARRLDPRDRA